MIDSGSAFSLRIYGFSRCVWRYGVGLIILIAGAMAFHWARRSAGYWSIDDAGITYAYAFRLAEHGSLSANIEGPAVEGYSNPLLFFVVALLRFLHLFDPITTHLFIEALAFGGMVLTAWSLLREYTGELAALFASALFAALELTTPATWIWYGSGLENVFVSLALLLLLYFATRIERGARLSPAVGVFAFAVALVRPEAPLYVATFYAVLLLFCRSSELNVRAHIRQVGDALVVTVALYLLFLGWRHTMYGAWLPNTYYAKLGNTTNIWDNFKNYLIGQIFPYHWSLAFSLSLLVLAAVPSLRRLAKATAVFTAASLAMPLIGGADWMGDHRFATAFFAMAQLSFAITTAVAFRSITAKPWNIGWPRRLLVLALVILPVYLFSLRKLAVRDSIPLSGVSILRVAFFQGVQRLTHQWRLGIPNPVMVTPDAGGALLVGALQLVDSAFLTDFHMARLQRDMHFVNQYQMEEHRADLADANPHWAFDGRLIGSHYLSQEDERGVARRDLIDCAAVPEQARLLFEKEGLRLYLSDETVPVAGPNGLVRVEVIVAWSKGAPTKYVRLRGQIDGGEPDEIALVPYGTPTASGIQRRALLLSAPPQAGAHPLRITLIHPSHTSVLSPLSVEVVTNDASFAQAAAHIFASSDVTAHLHRIARLREQAVARLGMVHFRALASALLLSHFERSRDGAEQLRTLAWTARLATLELRSPAIQAAEEQVIHEELDSPPCPRNEEAGRALCIGRRVDLLRRFGYFNVLNRVPLRRQELEAIALHIKNDEAGEANTRYRTLVGLTLALPDRLDLQQRLFQIRRALSVFPLLE